MLLLDEQTFDVAGQIDLSPPRKLMLDIKSVDQLAKIRTAPGDQVKILASRLACRGHRVWRD